MRRRATTELPDDDPRAAPSPPTRFRRASFPGLFCQSGYGELMTFGNFGFGLGILEVALDIASLQLELAIPLEEGFHRATEELAAGFAGGLALALSGAQKLARQADSDFGGLRHCVLPGAYPSMTRASRSNQA